MATAGSRAGITTLPSRPAGLTVSRAIAGPLTTAAPASVDSVVIGGGPAGLMAAETLLGAGCRVTLFESAPSVARKFLIAGKGGLNLTHAEDPIQFVSRYAERSTEVANWLAQFNADDLRRWAAELGYATVVGSSGRVFPADFKAGPMLRAWISRLRRQGLVLHTGMCFQGWDGEQLLLSGKLGKAKLSPLATVLALGGSSWSKLGASGAWVEILRGAGVEVAELQPSNCGFECSWSEHFQQRYAGQPVKPVVASIPGREPLRGEFVITRHGIEGSLIYALSASLREQLLRQGKAILELDLCPDRDRDWLRTRLSEPRGKRSWSEFARRRLGLDGARYGLLRELTIAADFDNSEHLAARIKRLPLALHATRPIDEAISCAGGVRFEALTADGMLRARPGVWCAGEMLDWEAPTGGYLLTACFASGRAAGRAAARWVRAQQSTPTGQS